MRVVANVRATEARVEVAQAPISQLELDENFAMGEQLAKDARGFVVSDSFQDLMEEEEDVFIDEELKEERERVLRWRNWRLSKYDDLAIQLPQMKEEEEFALNWMETTEIQEAVKLLVINGVYASKLNEKRNLIAAKGKAPATQDVEPQAITAEEAEEIEEARVQEAMRRSLAESTRPTGETSHAVEAQMVEDTDVPIAVELIAQPDDVQLIDYSVSPGHAQELPSLPQAENVQEAPMNEDDQLIDALENNVILAMNASVEGE